MVGYGARDKRGKLIMAQRSLPCSIIFQGTASFLSHVESWKLSKVRGPTSRAPSDTSHDVSFPQAPFVLFFCMFTCLLFKSSRLSFISLVSRERVSSFYLFVFLALHVDSSIRLKGILLGSMRLNNCSTFSNSYMLKDCWIHGQARDNLMNWK